MKVLASTGDPTDRTLYTYLPPLRGSKSFTLRRYGKVGDLTGEQISLPTNYCKVVTEKQGYVSVFVPEWLCQKRMTFFKLVNPSIKAY